MATFQITGLSAEAFRPLVALDDAALAARGIRRMRVDAKPGYPCRVSLQDGEVGETVYLLPHVHHDVASPYRASGPIFVREEALQAILQPDEIPAMLLHRLLSIRAYDADGMMVAAEVVSGDALREAIIRVFGQPSVAYLHVHNAKPGCFNCQVDRAN